jgi:hypothetical protein
MYLLKEHEYAHKIVKHTSSDKLAGSGDIDAYTLPDPVYLGFSGRTGGATNNHLVKNLNIGVGVLPPSCQPLLRFLVISSLASARWPGL